MTEKRWSWPASEAEFDSELELPSDDRRMVYDDPAAAFEAELYRPLPVEFFKGAMWGLMLSSVLWLAIIVVVVVAVS